MGDVLSRTREWLDRIYGGDIYAKALILGRQSSGPGVIFGYEDEDGSVRMTQLPMSGIDADQARPGAVLSRGEERPAKGDRIVSYP